MKGLQTIKRLISKGALLAAMSFIGLSTALAAPVSNSATGTLSGTALDLSNATVNLNSVAGGPAVTSVVAEISPNAVGLSSVGNAFTYDFLPTIGGNDTGVNELTITAPAAYTNLSVTAVSVGGSTQAAGVGCPTPAAGEYCAGIAGQVMTITLGTSVTTSLTNIQVGFTADAPTTVGSGDFTATLDDTATGTVAPQAGSAGDADGDAGDDNSITVSTGDQAFTTAVSEISPNIAVINTSGFVFTYDLLPTIGGNDTGVDQFSITTPASYNTNLIVSSVSVGGSPQVQSGSCPILAAGEYCASVTAGEVINIQLGSKVTTTLTPIQVQFTADILGITGIGIYPSTMDDTATSAASPQATTSGDADADAADANSQKVEVKAIDPDQSLVEADPLMVEIDRDNDGTPFSTIRVIPRDSAGSDLGSGLDLSIAPTYSAGVLTPGVRKSAPSAPFGLLTPIVDQGNGVYKTQLSSSVPGVVTVPAIVNGVTLTQKPEIVFTQGLVLDLIKTANKEEVVVGDVVTYEITLKNKTANDVTLVNVDDAVPPNFKYLKGSTLINGVKAPDPIGNRNLIFNIGTVPALDDSNNNGVADPGEPGYMTFSYQLVIGSGAMPGEYVNSAVAKDVCDTCFISNLDEAKVSVILDPIFDLGTIIGKVFEDKDLDGWQDKDELGVPGVMVALDTGTYAITDEFGRYHFPAILPGERLVKINLNSLPSDAETTTDEALIVSVTPGLLAKANFGVLYLHGVQRSVGRPGELGVLMESEHRKEAIEILGSVKSLTVLMNGQMATLSTTDLRMGVEALEEIIEIKGEKLEKAIEFVVEVDKAKEVSGWRLIIMDVDSETIRILQGGGSPQKVIRWDARTEKAELIQGGEIYQYQMEMTFADDSVAKSAKRLFGVNQTTAVSLRLTGAAFETGSATLGSRAKEVLQETAKVMRNFPKEKIVIEGHTDSVGSEALNLLLSKLRAESAADYLFHEEKIERDRLGVEWFGESKPMASNKIPEGRELNRRVEIKGVVADVTKTELLDQFRTKEGVRINGSPLNVGPLGRFASRLDGETTGQFEIEVKNAQGRSIQATIPVPRLEILNPTGEVLLPKETIGNGSFRILPSEKVLEGDEAIVTITSLVGRTDPGNEMMLDGLPIQVDPDGTFKADLHLKIGENPFGLLARNPEGYTRIANMVVRVSDQDEAERFLLTVVPIPNLSVQLPRPGRALKTPLLTLTGTTDPGNQVDINGQRIEIRPDGHFVETITLPQGRSTLVIQATDSEGYVATITQDVEVTDTQLFFLAFADGKFGQLNGRGYLKGAGMEKAREYYSEGRIAYYLKGVIAGKYLITSAFDTGTNEFDQLFKDLDDEDNDRLLTNIDPDKIYPVYGDDSTLVYDTESQGKFYLAVDSDEFHLLVGNYPLNLSDTELATYQRTLYGAKVAYQAASRTKYGDPDTKIVLFGAEVRQAHVRDELQATGGSLYFLSNRDLIEGSEQLTLVVRDKNTGLVLSRTPQQQNIDYTIKYEEGRVLFNRPISSVVEGNTTSGGLVDRTLLSGHPVFIQIDYETRVPSFEKTAGGGRVRQQIGDHVAVGSTYVKDELASGQYELKGLDAELRLGKNTRLIGEYVETTGTDSLTFQSTDGGLTFTEVTPTGIQTGEAWKLAAEIDIGEAFGAADRVQLGGYIKRLDSGFSSSGNFLEQGSRKTGGNINLKLTTRDRLLARYDKEERFGGISLVSSALKESDLTMVQWRHDHGKWDLTGEYQGRESFDTVGILIERASYVALRLQLRIGEKLSTTLEQQETLSGPENNQSTLGVGYQVLPSLKLEASGSTGTLGRAAQGGAILSLGNSNIYLTERLSDDRAGRSTATILGGETAMGPSSKIYSEYQWEHSDNGKRNVSLLGAQRQWDLVDGLRFMLTGEYSKIDASSQANNRYTIAPALSYRHPAGLKAQTRYELRRETGTQDKIQTLTTNFIELKLDEDFSLLTKYRYSVTRDRRLDKIEAKFEERSLGLAYRPVSHDLLNALLRYTQLSDQRPLSLSTSEFMVTKTEVASVEWSLEINRHLEWVDKEAIKIKREETGGRSPVTTHTMLSIHRFNVHLWKKLDLGLEYRILMQKEADDQREGWLLDLAWRIEKHFRVGVGYNFTDFSDNEFSENNYSVQGWFIRVQAKF